MAERDFLSWPFFESRHRELAAELDGWCADNIADRYADDTDSECRALVRELGAAGFLRLTVGDADNRPDVRSLAIARDTLAFHSGLADFERFAQALGWNGVRMNGISDERICSGVRTRLAWVAERTRAATSSLVTVMPSSYRSAAR